MSRTYRMLAPSKTLQSPITVNGRVYSQTPGLALDIDIADAPILAAAGWLQIGLSGATVARPTVSDQSMFGLLNPASRQFSDTSLGITVFHDGAAWRDPNTGNAV